MASEEKGKATPAAPPPSPTFGLFRAAVGLRLLLLAATFAPVIVMATSKQTIVLEFPSSDPFAMAAKFTYSPALTYFLVAMAVACLYTLISFLVSLGAVYKRFPPSKKLFFYLALLDALMVGVTASATGAAAAVAYVGLKGNSHVGWSKICDMYGRFCRHVGTSVIFSLISCLLLLLLVLLSTYSLYNRNI